MLVPAPGRGIDEASPGSKSVLCAWPSVDGLESWNYMAGAVFREFQMFLSTHVFVSFSLLLLLFFFFFFLFLLWCVLDF